MLFVNVTAFVLLFLSPQKQNRSYHFWHNRLKAKLHKHRLVVGTVRFFKKRFSRNFCPLRDENVIKLIARPLMRRRAVEDIEEMRLLKHFFKHFVFFYPEFLPCYQFPLKKLQEKPPEKRIPRAEHIEVAAHDIPFPRRKGLEHLRKPRDAVLWPRDAFKVCVENPDGDRLLQHSAAHKKNIRILIFQTLLNPQPAREERK